MNILKSVGSVAAGFITVVVLSVVTDLLLEKFGVFPSQDPSQYVQWMLGLALAYRLVYALAGGYVAAALAPNRPMRHVLILAIFGFAFGGLGSLANADKSTAATAWYPIALVILSVPAVWLGGKLKISAKGGSASGGK